MRAAPVLYVTLEGGAGFERRVSAPWTIRAFGCFPRALCFMDLRRDPTWLTEAVEYMAQETGRFGLIVIDTLARAMVPGDEKQLAGHGAAGCIGRAAERAHGRVRPADPSHRQERGAGRARAFQPARGDRYRNRGGRKEEESGRHRGEKATKQREHGGGQGVSLTGCAEVVLAERTATAIR